MSLSTTLPAGVFVGPIALAETAALSLLLWRRGTLSVARLATIAGIGLYTAAVLCVTIFPLQIETGVYGNFTSWTDRANLTPIITIDAATFLPNILMLMPLGVLIPLLWRRPSWWVAARTGFLVSAGIELTQWVTDVLVNSGRLADVNDLIANTLGAVLGYALVRAAFTTRSGTILAAHFALWSSEQHRTARLTVNRRRRPAAEPDPAGSCAGVVDTPCPTASTAGPAGRASNRRR